MLLLQKADPKSEVTTNIPLTMKALAPWPSLVALGSVLLALLGCDDPGPQKNPFDPPKDAPVKPPPVTEVPKPKGPPELSIDNLSPKIGFSRVLLQKPTDREKLKNELLAVRNEFEGKEATVVVDRKAESKWVIAMMEELANIGAQPIVIKTSSRTDFTQQLTMDVQFRAGKVADCSVVTAILTDRSTAVWKLSGGTAARRGKGLGGPDLSMTGETIERYGKACKQSNTLFVSGAEGIEWGLIYDLAASTKKIEKVSFERIILLSEPPTAGRAVKL
jgi:biopolymer transport protein ExbD